MPASDPETALPPFTMDGFVPCPECKGEAKHFNCECVRCDQPGCNYISIADDCGAMDGYGSAGAPWM